MYKSNANIHITEYPKRNHAPQNELLFAKRIVLFEKPILTTFWNQHLWIMTLMLSQPLTCSIVLLFAYQTISFAAKFAMIPMAGKSHYLVHARLGQELENRGHEVNLVHLGIAVQESVACHWRKSKRRDFYTYTTVPLKRKFLACFFLIVAFQIWDKRPECLATCLWPIIPIWRPKTRTTKPTTRTITLHLHI